MNLHHGIRSFRRLLTLLAVVLGLASGMSGAANYNLRFVNPGNCPANASGANAAVGSSCRYTNVVVDNAGNPLPAASVYQRDVIVTLSKLTGGAIVAGTATNPNAWDNDGVLLDNAGAAHPEFFTPTVTAPNTANAVSWAEFTFQFVPAGGASTTTTPLPGTFYMTSFDTDGNGAANGLREFIEFLGPVTSAVSTTPASADQPGAAVDGGTNYEAIATTNQAAIGSGAAYKASAQFATPGIVKFAVGARQGTAACGGACERLSAYSFQVADAVVLSPAVDGYKSVKLTTDADGNGVVTPGDTLTYTITYTNTGNAAETGFQMTDSLPAGVTITAAGAQTVRLNGTVTAGARNTTYNGSGTNTLLAAGQTLPVNSTVSVDIPVVVSAVATDNTVLSNQSGSSGNYTNAAGASVAAPAINSDNVDNTTVFPSNVAATTGFGSVPAGSLAQTQANTVDSTTVVVRRLPQLTLNKTIAAPGRVNTADQFTVQIKNGATVTASASTTGTATTAATAATPVVSGTSYTLTEILAAGSVSALTAYDTAISCTNSTAGSATTLPSGTGQSFTLTPNYSDVISCTLTNTAKTYSVSGRVYEDYNFGGGAGRAYNAASGMSLRPNVRVELYNAGGTFVAAALTDASGAYTFTGLLPANYTTRVVNSFVTSSRTGACAQATNLTTPPAGCAQLPVQTFANGNTALVGGNVPAGADPVLSTSTLPAGAESTAAVTVGSANVTGVDFGYNFDTVVNTNDTGQGSLRQFVNNSNALSNTGLAQVGQTAGKEVSIFQIPSGALTGGVAVIPLASGVTVTDTDTTIDGGTQTTNVGNTNIGVLGTGGTVGVDGLTLSQVNKPEVEITLSGNNTVQVNGNNFTLRNVALHGGGNGGANTGELTLGTAGTAASNALIEKNVFGTTATAFTVPGSLTSQGYGVSVVNGSGSIQNNLIGYSGISGINYIAGDTGLSIQGNEFQQNGYTTSGGDAITVAGSANAKPLTITGNLIANSNSSGIQFEIGSVANNTVSNNTITANGLGGTANRLEGSGIHYLARNNAVNSTNTDTVSKNVISGNQRSGVVLNFGQSNVTISQNSFSNNGLTSIDFTASDGYVGGNANYGQGNGVTPNDGATVAREGNTGLDYPVFNTVYVTGTTLTVAGFVGNGVSTTFDGKTAKLELYKAADDGNQNGAVIVGDGKSVPHGEGFTYLGTLTVTLGINGAFSGSITIAAGALTSTDKLTATTTIASNTSEFSPNVYNLPPTTIDATNAVLLDTAAATVLNPNLSAADTDGTIASYTIVTLPAAASGVLSVNGAAVTAGQTFTAAQLGTLSFDPATGFNGNATFTYTATDNQGAVSNTSTYTIPVNVAPVAVSDTSSTPAGTAKTFSVTGNDTDTAPGTVNVASTLFAATGQPAGSTLSNGNRTIAVPNEGSYTLDNAGNVTFTPVAGYSGTTTAVKYTVADNQGAVSNVANITVTVTPVATNDTANTTPSTLVNIPVLNNDLGKGKVLTSLLFPAGQPAGSTVTNGGKTLTNADGVYTIKTDGTVDFTPALGKTGTLTPVLYTFVDGAGQTSNTATITVTVSSIVPPTATNDSKTTPKNTAVTLEGSTNDTAGSLPLDNASVVLTAGGTVSNAGKTLTNAQGTYQVQANGTVIFTPVSTFAGTTTPVSYTVKDTSGATSNTATLSVTVTNQPPVANNVTNTLVTSTAPAAALNPGVSGTDPDGNVVTYTITTLPTAAMGTLYCNGAAIASVPSACAPAQLTFKPNPAFNGNATFQYTVTDDNGATSAVATYTIPVNKPPVATNDSGATDPNVSVTFSITGNDTDTAPGTVDVTTAVFDPSSTGTISNAGKTLTIAGEGVYTIANNGNVTFAPAAGFNNGVSTAKYTVKDNQGAVSNIATITVNVPASVDLAISKVGPAFFKPGDTLSYTLTVTNSGSAASGVTVTDTLPAGLTFASASNGGTYSAATGKVSWTVGAVANSATVTLTVTGTAPTAASVETNSGPTSLVNTASTQANETEVVTNNNTATSTSQLVYPKLTKRVRNVTQNGAFGTVGTGKPGEILEYCIDFKNYGVAVANFVISDSVPSNTNANLSAYGAGLGLQVVRGATTTRTSSNADADGGSLSSAALSLDLGTLAAGENGSVCFQSGIK
ncbi:beta strand repeat-containing protein [Deinococcus sp. UYEF24]